MNQPTDENISALIDEYLSQESAADTLESIQQSEQQQHTLRNYQLIGQALRKETIMLDASDIAAHVSQLLDDEPIVFAPIHRQKRWFQPIDIKKISAGLALAASVAAISLFSFSTKENTLDTPSFTIDSSQLTKVSLSPSTQPYMQPPSTQWKQIDQPEVEQHLNNYIVGHGNHAPRMGGSMLTYTSFVSYDSKR